MPRSPVPVVGIPASIKDFNGTPFHAVNQRYLCTLTDTAGVVPMIVPSIGERHDFADLVDRFDGLLFTGSPANVEPHRYGHDRAREDILHDPGRDETTLPLLREAVERGVPFFAICLGIQELNVALGGTLHQLVQELPGKHDHRSDKTKPKHERTALAHPIAVTAGGTLHRHTGGKLEVMVNSLHGQAIDRVADRLQVEAVAPDGVVEAVSVRGATTFQLGVQWHPESLCGDDPLSQALFEAFGDAVRAHAAARRARVAA